MPDENKNGFWNQFGNTYDEVDKKTNGIAGFFKNLGEKVKDPAMSAITGFNQSVMQSLPGVIARRIVPGAEEQWQKNLSAMQPVIQAHPAANTAGLVTGGLAQAFTSPTIPGAAAGTVAAKIVPTLGRNLLNSLTSTIPDTIAQGAQTGDWGEAIKSGLKGTAIGTLLGSATEKALGSLPAIRNAIKKSLMGQAISGGLGIDSRALKKVTTYGPIGKYAGAVMDRSDSLKEKLVDLMIDNPAVKTEAGRKALVDRMDSAWGRVDEAWKAYKPAQSMGKVRSLQNEILSHPLVQEVLTSDPDMISKLDEIITKADKGKDLAAVRHILKKDFIDPSYLKGSKILDEQIADLGRGVQDIIDNRFVPDTLKESYAMDKILKEALMREDLKLPSTLIAGSPTFARTAASTLLGGAGFGVAGYDPEDPMKTVRNSILGGLVGGAGGRLASNTLNKVLAGPEAKLAGMISRIPETALTKVSNMAPYVTRAAAAIPQTLDINEAVQGQSQAAQLPTPWTDLPTQPDPPKVPMALQKGIDEATNQEQRLSPDQVDNARNLVANVFGDKIREKMLADWQSWDNPWKADFETFFDQAKQATNNFDPKNVNTAKIVAGPNYKEYLKSYNVALNLQSLGKDLIDALNYRPGLDILGTRAADKEKHDRLVKTLYTAMTGELKDPSKAEKASIEDTLNTIRRGGGDKKAKELFDLLENQYGVRFDLLRQFGAIT